MTLAVQETLPGGALLLFPLPLPPSHPSLNTCLLAGHMGRTEVTAVAIITSHYAAAAPLCHGPRLKLNSGVMLSRSSIARCLWYRGASSSRLRPGPRPLAGQVVLAIAGMQSTFEGLPVSLLVRQAAQSAQR